MRQSRLRSIELTWTLGVSPPREMLNLLAKIQANISDARVMGLRFVGRHLRPWASRHSFQYAGRPVTFRRGSSDTEVIRYLLVHGEYRLAPEADAKVRAD